MQLSDVVFDDMAMSNKADRKKFRRVCQRSCDEQEVPRGNKRSVVFEDWKVYLSVLLQMGCLDIHRRRADRYVPALRDTCGYNTDADGRICYLIVSPRTPCDFPKGFHRLDRLKDLQIHCDNITSLPLRELNSLQKLEHLGVHSISRVLSDSLCGRLQEAQKLTRVKTLWLDNRHSFQMLSLCPSLEELRFDSKSSGDLDPLLNHLGSTEMENLQSMDLASMKFNGEQLAKLILEIVPRFPNFEKLRFSCCCTTDIRVLLDRLRSGKSWGMPKSLRRFATIFDDMDPSSDPVFKADTLTLFKFFPTLDSIDWSVDDADFYEMDYDGKLGFRTDPDWVYAVVKNTVGRRIVERGGGSSSSRLPLSVWPIILQRAQQEFCGFDEDGNRKFCQKFGYYDWFDENDRREFCQKFEFLAGETAESLAATGIYYLLRKGSALIGRRDLVDGPERPPPSKRQKRA